MSYDLARSRASSPMTRTGRQTAREVELAQRGGLRAAAAVEAASFASHVALHHAGMLTGLEAQLIERAPLGEARYKAIVDTFTGVACAELSALTYR